MKKSKPCPYCGRLSHAGWQCFQKNKVLYERRKAKPYKPAKKASSSVDQNLRKKLIKELDKYTSLICRLGASDANGIASCYTCGKRDVWNNFDCGHFIKRSFFGTRWLQADVRTQCRSCNRLKNGNYQVYEPKIKRELGVDEVQKLWDKAYQHKKFSTAELMEMLEKVKQDYKNLVAERKGKGWKV